MKKVMLLFLTVSFLSVIFLSACSSNGNDEQAELKDPDETIETESDNVDAEEDLLEEYEVGEESDEVESEKVEEQVEEESKSHSDSEESTESESGEPQVVAENDAFRVFEPAPDSVIHNKFVVRGEARVFEATFQFEFEDGHNILGQGTITASSGAPEWGEFEFTVSFDDVFFETGILILYEESAKDGSRINELMIPLKVEK